MRTYSRWVIGLLGMIAILAVLDSKAEAQVYGGRQYYSFWHTAPAGDYYYREYYFKPAPSYTTYVVHQVHYYPQYPHYCYYYNPQSQTYWGRVPVERDGKAMYSLLDEKDRKSKLEDIPEMRLPGTDDAPAAAWLGGQHKDRHAPSRPAAPGREGQEEGELSKPGGRAGRIDSRRRGAPRSECSERAPVPLRPVS